jgi:hypothetical protein
MASKNRNMLAGSKTKTPPGRPSDRLILALAGFIVLGIVLGVVALVKVSSPKAPPVAQAIVGKWVNATGGQMEFRADGSGYLPPTLETVPYSFTYSLPDDTHLVMKVAGQMLTVQIELVDDKLTWYTADPNVKYVYTRAK